MEVPTRFDYGRGCYSNTASPHVVVVVVDDDNDDDDVFVVVVVVLCSVSWSRERCLWWDWQQPRATHRPNVFRCKHFFVAVTIKPR